MCHDILHLHGFASSARSAKALFLKDKFQQVPGIRFFVPDFNPTQKDFESLTITGMISRLRQYVLENNLKNISLVGSSLGGLVGLHYARRFGGVRRLLLLAPVLSYTSVPVNGKVLDQWDREGTIEVFHYGFQQALALRYDFHRDGLCYGDLVAPPAPVRILHGRHDSTVPLSNSEVYAAQYPDSVSLVTLESDHGLLNSLEVVWESARSFLISY